MPLTHLSLFSGIGGLDLAAEWAGFLLGVVVTALGLLWMMARAVVA